MLLLLHLTEKDIYAALFRYQRLNFGLDFNSDFLQIAPEVLILVSIFALIGIFGTGYSSKKEMLLDMHIYNHAVLVAIVWILVIPFSFEFGSGCSFYYLLGSTFQEETFKIDCYTQSIKIVITIAVIVMVKYYNFTKNFINAGELIILIQISLLLAFIIISCCQYIVLLLALEGFSLALYILATIDRSQGGIMAAAKYFVFGTLGSILLLWGVVHLYLISPYLAYRSISESMQLALLSNNSELLASYNFATTALLLGLLIKLGAAPFHQWVPSVYAGVHLVITTYFSTVVKLVIFSVFCTIALSANSSIITFFAVISLIVGSFITLRQTEIKRFLAYSSIAHVGFLLMGDLTASYLYIITYICSSLLFFSVLLSTTINNGKELIYLTDLRVIKRSSLWTTLILVISLSSMAGLPPFAGFFGKYFVWSSLIEDIILYNNNESYILLLVSVGLTLVTIYYYMRLIIFMYVCSDWEPIPGVEIKETDSFFQTVIAMIITLWILLQPKMLSIISAFSFSIILNTYSIMDDFYFTGIV